VFLLFIVGSTGGGGLGGLLLSSMSLNITGALLLLFFDSENCLLNKFFNDNISLKLMCEYF
jgi:hypothetical protein